MGDIFSLLESTIQEMREGALVFFDDEKIIQSNHSANVITGYSSIELHTITFSSLLSNQNDYDSIREVLQKESHYHGLVEFKRKSGELFKSKVKISRTKIGKTSHCFLVVFEKTTYQSRAQKELRVATKIYENIEEGIVCTDRKGRILFVNPAFEMVTGYLEGEIIGKNPSVLQSGYHQQDFYQNFWKEVNEKGSWKGEIWNKRKDGEIYPEWLTISSIKDQDGQITNYVAVFSDIKDRKEKEDQILKLSTFDRITGTVNSNMLAQEFQQLIETSKKYNQTLAVLFLDLDRFKVINETLGHSYGDLLLKKVASRLKGLLQNKDLIARFGGDEFVIILPNIQHAKEAVHMSEEILSALQQPFLIKDKELFITASIGIALYPFDGDHPDVLIKHAIKSMSNVKSKGRNNFEIFDQDLLPANASRRIILENKLRKAMENNEFVMYYQPQVETKTGFLIGVEALLRWKNPELGMISPGEFIPIAEEIGLIIPISEWVISQACEEIKRLHVSGYPNLKVSINVSGLHFNQKQFVKNVTSIIQNTNINPHLVELELTESVIMPNATDSIDKLVNLKQKGYKLSIDDFGTGYSSLSYLHRFPIDALKIDQSFIRKCTSFSDDAAIVKAIITMAKTLQLKVIAEGVENKKQVNFLRQEKCDIIQGFYLSRPIPFSELKEFVELWNPYMLNGK